MAVRIVIDDLGGGTNYPGGLGGVLSELRDKLAGAFSSVLGNLKKAAAEANALTDAFLGGAAGADALTDSVKKTAAAAAKAAKRILADFDEIQRLGSRASGGGASSSRGSSGGSSSGSTAEAERVAAVIQALMDRIKEAITSLREAYMNVFASFFTAVQAGFQELTSVEKLVSGLLTSICASFLSSWNGIWNVLAGTQARLNEKVIQPVLSGVSGLVVKVQTSFESIRLAGTNLFAAITASAAKGWEAVGAVWATASAWFGANVARPIAAQFSKLWSLVYDLTGAGLERTKEMLMGLAVWIGTDMLRNLAALFASLWENIASGAVRVSDGIKTVFQAAIQTLGNTFRNAWASVIKTLSVNGTVFVDIRDGVLSAFKTIVNDLIRGLNSVLHTTFSGINTALQAMKNTEIQGQKPFSGLKTISVPQIPYLAQGAVLPANRPFLAMVGDQRHGTNVEAPLSTIQEAVAVVMEDQTKAILAGFEGSIGVQREILEAVLGIRIGDEIIGQAAARYQRKMAVVRGGCL